MSQPSQPSRPAPAVLLIALVVVAQALALLLNAILTVFDADSGQLPGTALFFLVFLYLLGATWLIGAAIGVIKGKAWPRGTLIVAELLAVIVSFTYFQMGEIVLALALVLSGAVVLIGLFTPALTQHMVQRRGTFDT